MSRLAKGRRAAEALAQDTTPGKILVLGLLANLPILVMTIVLALTDDRDAARRFAPYILFGTPIFAIVSLGFYRRAPAERRKHNASKWGFRLALVALGLWVLVLIPTLRG